MNCRVGLLLAVLPGIAAAQAVVEYSLGAGRATTMSAPAQKAGKSIAGAFDSLNRTLQSQDQTSTSKSSTVIAQPSRPQKAAAVKTSPPAAAAEPQPEVSYEDPSGIAQGMESAEVLRRFGPPSMKMTTGPGEEMLSYSKKNSNLSVTMQNGKVASVEK